VYRHEKGTDHDCMLHRVVSIKIWSVHDLV
jgi:hypothetical protein